MTYADEDTNRDSINTLKRSGDLMVHEIRRGHKRLDGHDLEIRELRDAQSRITQDMHDCVATLRQESRDETAKVRQDIAVTSSQLATRSGVFGLVGAMIPPALAVVWLLIKNMAGAG